MSNLKIALSCLDYVEFGLRPNSALEVAKGETWLTYRGITEKYSPEFVGWTKVHLNLSLNNQNLSRASVACFTDSELDSMVLDFYDKKIFSALNLSLCTDQTKANMIFTTSALIGVVTCSKIAQIALGVTPDGVIGSKTMDALNKSDYFLSDFVAISTVFLTAKVRVYPHLGINLVGWINRLQKVLNYDLGGQKK